MNRLIDWDELVKINKDAKVQSSSVGGEPLIVVDDFLTKESFSEILELLNTLDLSYYKARGGGCIDARYQGSETIKGIDLFVNRLIRGTFHKEVIPIYSFSINYFKNLDTTTKFIGGAPHVDAFNGYAALLYLNETSIEGTAIYTNKEGLTVIKDYNSPLPSKSNYKFTEEEYSRDYTDRVLIPGVPNRLVIYNANIIHGAAHTETEHVDDFRRTLITFYSTTLTY